MGNMYAVALRDVDVYLEVSEHWIQHHEEAMACRDLEEVIARGIVVFDLISHVDEWWHIQVFNNPSEYDAESHQRILELYKKWSTPCPEVLKSVERFLAMGFDIPKAEEFKKRCREANSVGKVDGRIAASDALIDLRDKAVEEFRTGRTHEYRAT